MIPVDAGIPDGTLPSNVYRYQVAAQARTQPTVELQTVDGRREATLIVSHPDVAGGKFDVVGMLVWGDIDPNFHPMVEQSDTDSTVMPFRPKMPIVFSAGAGVKTIHVRIHFRSGQTAESSVDYTLADGDAHVTVLAQPFQEVLLPSDLVKIGWSASHAFTDIYVGLTSDWEATIGECALLTTGTNVTGSGSWIAGQYVESSFSHVAALAVFPDLDMIGQVYVKVFVRTPRGVTS